jgi:hypothetical protein
MVCLAACLACGGGSGGGGIALTDLAVSSGTLSPAFDPEITDYDVSSLNSLQPVRVTASTQATCSLAINGQAAVSGVPASLGLAPGQGIEVALTLPGLSSPERTYRIHATPAGLPGFTVAGTASASDGFVLLNAGTYSLIVDKAGNLRYYRDCGVQVSGFRRFDLAGSSYYTYNTVDADVVQIRGTYIGSAHVLDSGFEEIGQLRLLPHGSHGAYPADMHEFLLFSPTHWLAMAYVPTTLDLSGLNPSWGTAAQVNACIVQEVQDGAVVFEWNSTDYPELYAQSVEGNALTNGTPSDYAHLNSVFLDPRDGNLILSFRHLDEILKVDRGTGNILWILGGAGDMFGLAGSQRFSHQHHATIQDDGTLLVFDNGNPAGPTRVLSFALDESLKTVTAFSVLGQKPADWAFSAYMGSAQRLDAGRYLVGWGGTFGTNPADPDVSELLNGSPVWSLSFNSAVTFTYRAFQVPATAGW